MFAIGPVGFAVPALLSALIALPILWFILRAVPPAAIRLRFPGISLLLGLNDDESETDRTPWWLLLLRCAAIAAAIIAFAGPVLNPKDRQSGTGPLLVILDGTWASAPSWQNGLEGIGQTLSDAGRDGRPVAVVSLSNIPAGPILFQGANDWVPQLPSFEPKPWEPDRQEIDHFLNSLLEVGSFDTVWFSDGLMRDTRETVLAAVKDKGQVVVFETQKPIFALGPARFEDGQIKLDAHRSQTGGSHNLSIVARGRDPAGTERDLSVAEAQFTEGDSRTEIALALPAELRNRITRFEVSGTRSAGAVSLADDGLKRREIALISGREDREGLELLSPLHYLERAVVETSDILEGDLTRVLPANPDVIVLADVAQISELEAESLQSWIDEGGLLVRFAGPRLAASDVSRDDLDPLMPVRLRAGGRIVGGAMSWGEPKAVRPFDPKSPFFGLAVPEEVTVSAQVMAQPDPQLAGRVIASLADGTPLITRRKIGQGQVILFHVTANAEWSTLPLSGLFVQMLERLAISTRPSRPDAEALVGTTWVPEKVLSGHGVLEDAGAFPGVPGETLANGNIGPNLPPGLYRGEDRRLAVNVIATDAKLEPAIWPADVRVEGYSISLETPLKGAILAAAVIMLLADILVDRIADA